MSDPQSSYPTAITTTCECVSDLKYLGRLKEDNRQAYGCKKCSRVGAKNLIPTTLYGPTHTEIKQFEEEHADAEACPKCGYKFFVTGFGIHLAMMDGGCCVCSRLSPTNTGDKDD